MPVTTDPAGRSSWQSTERVLESGAFESRQRLVVAGAVAESSGTGARWLGVTYWQAVSEFSRGAVRARWSETGGRLTLLGGPTLLRFGLPEVSFDGETVSCRFAIEGGMLAVRAGGSVTLTHTRLDAGSSSPSRSRSTFPAWRRGQGPRGGRECCTPGQSPFHAGVSRRYFELLIASART